MFPSIGAKRRWLQRRLKRRYRELLAFPTWTEAELAGLGAQLRAFVEHGMKEQERIKRRLAHKNTALMTDVEDKPQRKPKRVDRPRRSKPDPEQFKVIDLAAAKTRREARRQELIAVRKQHAEQLRRHQEARRREVAPARPARGPILRAPGVITYRDGSVFMRGRRVR
jgi:hypothetical protein